MFKVQNLLLLSKASLIKSIEHTLLASIGRHKASFMRFGTLRLIRLRWLNPKANRPYVPAYSSNASPQSVSCHRTYPDPRGDCSQPTVLTYL
jgi:hypothetical protein